MSAISTSGEAEEIQHAAAAEPRSGLSVTQFLTDGSLAGLCDELARLTGVAVRLFDPAGRRIVRTGSVDRPWTVEESGGDSTPEAGGIAVPLMALGRPIGSLVIDAGDPRLTADAREVLERVVALLASTAGEFCDHELELRHRVREIQALYRLSGLLARATDVDRVLSIALQSAIDVLALDAGSVVLFEHEDGVRTPTEEDLVYKASVNLSRTWLESPLPLSKGRQFDRLALGGGVVVSEDLEGDARVSIPEEARREGLRACLHVGMVFQDKPLGVLRLYARTPRRFTDAEQRLVRSIAHQAAVAIEQAKLLKMQENEARIQRQVAMAADVQRRMLPRGLPNLPQVDVAARYVPSFELGGDFYDVIEMADHRGAGASAAPDGAAGEGSPGVVNLGLAIGDVVGKGVAAALLMASVRASLRAHVQDLYHLDDVIARVNAAMCRDTRDNEFATLWYGVLDLATRRLTYCSAGHDSPFVVRVPANRAPTAADIDDLSVGGMAVGIDPTQKYQRGMYDLQPGDVIVAYTDGVCDMLDFQRRKFGKGRLRKAVLDKLSADPRASAGQIVEHVFWELRQFGGLLERPDDQTLLVVRVR